MVDQATGRGAWTTRGFPDGSGVRMYRRLRTPVPVGGEAERDLDHLAVNRGVLAIQRLLDIDYSTGPGIFGPRTDAAVRAYQKVKVPPADGIVGPNTMRALLKPVVSIEETVRDIPAHLLWGLIAQESGYDPGAVGYTTPSDLGLVQINTAVQPVTPDQAFDPLFSIKWAANRMRKAYDKYSAKLGPEEYAKAWDCAVASHNSPAAADSWANGALPTLRVTDYVARVRAAGSKW